MSPQGESVGEARAVLGLSHPPRRALALLMDGPFAAVFWGKACTSVATWMHALVAVVVIYDMSGSATAVSLVSLAQFAPQIVLAPLAGMWADRGGMARLIILGHVLAAVGSGGVALVLLGDPSPVATIAGVFGFTLLSGIGLAILGPPLAAIVPGLIRPGELSRAMTLSTLPNTLGRLAGPAIGALAIATIPHAASFAICTFVYVLAVVAMLVPSFPQTAPAVGGPASVAPFRAGLRYVAGHRGLRLMLLATLTLSLGSEPTLTLAPALSEHLRGDESLVGWLTSGFGLGALVGSGIAMVAPRVISVRTCTTTGLVLLAAGIGLVGVFHSAAWAVGCFVVAGLGFAVAIAGLSTLVQAHVAPERRGLVTGLWLIAFVGARPLAALLVGLVADHGTLSLAFACAGSLVLATVWATRPSALGPRAMPM